jgi:hypothetical protein
MARLIRLLPASCRAVQGESGAGGQRQPGPVGKVHYEVPSLFLYSLSLCKSPPETSQASCIAQHLNQDAFEPVEAKCKVGELCQHDTAFVYALPMGETLCCSLHGTLCTAVGFNMCRYTDPQRQQRRKERGLRPSIFIGTVSQKLTPFHGRRHALFCFSLLSCIHCLVSAPVMLQETLNTVGPSRFCVDIRPVSTAAQLSRGTSLLCAAELQTRTLGH